MRRFGFVRSGVRVERRIGDAGFYPMQIFLQRDTGRHLMMFAVNMAAQSVRRRTMRLDRGQGQSNVRDRRQMICRTFAEAVRGDAQGKGKRNEQRACPTDQ